MKSLVQASPRNLLAVTLILMFIPYFDDGQYEVEFGFYSTVFLSLILVNWYYSIGSLLATIHRRGNLKLFRFNYIFITSFAMLSIIMHMLYITPVADYKYVYVVLTIYTVYAFLQMIFFCSDNLSLHFEGKKDMFYKIKYVFLLWIFPLGIWLIQPKLNKIIL